MKKILILQGLLALMLILPLSCFAAEYTLVSSQSDRPTFLQAVINTEEAVELKKNNIFDASQSFVPDSSRKIIYSWNFGDGETAEGVEVPHSYFKPGKYTVTLTINDGINQSELKKDIFVYRKLILLITDQTEAKNRIEIIHSYGEDQGVYLQVIESFGSNTEFISQEILARKINEELNTLQKAHQVIIWTKENAGLSALSRVIKSNSQKTPINFTQKTIVVLTEDIGGIKSRIQKEFNLIKPENIILAKEASIYPVIESTDYANFLRILQDGGYEYTVIDGNTGKLRPWNFMTYFVNFLMDQGIPDNAIALLLLLPVIAFVVTIMKQVIGITTFGIYTPSIITLSFLIIGMYMGLLTLIVAISVGMLLAYTLNKVRILFIPKMAILITIVSLVLFLILIIVTYGNLFDAEFLSIAIFPMLILSTLVEKFISVKTEKGLSSAILLTSETVFVSIIAYFIAGGEVNLGFLSFQFNFVKNLMLAAPETIFLLLIADFLLGKWTGLRLLEIIRFREILRHVEE